MLEKVSAPITMTLRNMPDCDVLAAGREGKQGAGADRRNVKG